MFTRHFGGLNSSKTSQVCHIMVFAATFWENIEKQSIFFNKKHGKHDYYTMIMVWIMTTTLRNIAAMPSSWQDHDHFSPWSWQDHGIAAVFFQPGGGELELTEKIPIYCHKLRSQTSFRQIFWHQWIMKTGKLLIDFNSQANLNVAKYGRKTIQYFM